MSTQIEARLQELGLTLPAAAAPVGNYVPYVLQAGQLFVSGQLPMGADGRAYAGKLGADVDIETGQQAARQCALNVLAQAKAALDGDLARITRCLKLGGFVNATPDFTDHPRVMNGASDLMVAILGDCGRHARIAVGCSGLPAGAAVEVDAVFAVQ